MHSLETRQKMREAKLRVIANGWRPWNKGKSGVYSEVSRKKMSAAKKVAPPKSVFKSGTEHKNWRGGTIKKGQYVYIYSPSHPSATTKGYVLEHRLVMEKFLGRYLRKGEEVHHRNTIKDDNRLENLELVLANAHQGRIICPNCDHEFLIK